MTPHELNAKPNPQLLPQAVLAAAGDAEEREIAVGEIDPQDNVRKHFDQDALRALADNIAANGLLKSIIVYHDPHTKRYRLIGGERRWRAHQLLGRKTIRARVLKQPPDPAKRSELMLIDNEQEDLDDIERGLAYLDYTSRFQCTASALAQKLGKHVSTVTRAIALIRKLPEDLRAAIGPGLPPTIAGLLTSLPDDDAKRHFAGLYREGTIKTGKELAAAIRAARNGQAAGATAGFACEENGVRIAVTWTTDAAEASPGHALAAAENALKIVLKDLREQG